MARPARSWPATALPPGRCHVVGPGPARRTDGPPRRRPADPVRHAGDVRLQLSRAGRGRLGRAHERPGAGALRLRARPPQGLGAGAAAGPGASLPRGLAGPRRRSPGRADRQPRRPARPGRRHAGAVPGALRRRRHPGAGAPLGHDDRRPHEALDAAVAGRHARRNPAGHPVADPVGRVRAHSAQPEIVLRPRRRQLRLPAGTRGQRLAPPRHRAPGLSATALVVHRPLLRRQRRVRSALAAAVDRRDGRGPRAAGLRLSVPAGRTGGRPAGVEFDLLPAVQHKILAANTQTFFGLDR